MGHFSNSLDDALKNFLTGMQQASAKEERDALLAIALCLSELDTAPLVSAGLHDAAIRVRKARDIARRALATKGKK